LVNAAITCRMGRCQLTDICNKPENQQVSHAPSLETLTADQIGVWGVCVIVRRHGGLLESGASSPSMLWNDSVIEDQNLDVYTLPLTAVPLRCAIDLMIRMVRKVQSKAAGCSGEAEALTCFRDDP
jgi:hypothetical protein